MLELVLRLDYISCLLTVVSTVLIGRRLWHGWIVAGVNSAIICIIGVRTAQTGFIPANLFCLGIYGYNLIQWRASGENPAAARELVEKASAHRSRTFLRLRGRGTRDDESVRHSDRILARRLRHPGKSRSTH